MTGKNKKPDFVFAGLAPHPPIVVPEVGRGREEGSRKTIEAFEQFAGRLMETRPEVLVLISPHSPRQPGAFGYWDKELLHGDLAKFNTPEVEISLPNAVDFLELLKPEAEKRDVNLWPVRDGLLDHGVLVPLYYLKKAGWAGPTAILSLNYPGEGQFEDLGNALASAAAKAGGRVALVASGDMSHRLEPGAPGGYHPEAARFDHEFVELLETGHFLEVADMDPELVELAGQDVIESTRIALAAIHHDATRRDVLSYEGPFGVGYCLAVLWQDRAEENSGGGKALLNVARRSMEDYVRRGILPRFEDSPVGYLARKAGVFITVRLRDGSLRGCIGTLGPTRLNLVEEVADRALAVAKDAYGGPIREDELENLVYEISVLCPPVGVRRQEELDPALYGVIMRDAWGRRAVLLPGIESIQTVSDQLEFVRKKACIPQQSDVMLDCFCIDKFCESTEEKEPCY